MALRIPISRVRSITELSSTFMIPMPPTMSEMLISAPMKSLKRNSAFCRLLEPRFVRHHADSILPPGAQLARRPLLDLRPHRLHALQRWRSDEKLRGPLDRSGHDGAATACDGMIARRLRSFSAALRTPITARR